MFSVVLLQIELIIFECYMTCEGKTKGGLSWQQIVLRNWCMTPGIQPWGNAAKEVKASELNRIEFESIFYGYFS